MRKIILIGLMVLALFGCSANRVVPNTPGEAALDAYGTLEKAAAVTTVLLRNNLISVERAKAVRKQIADGYAALNAATAAISAGDLSTSVAKLQFAKTIVDELARYVAENTAKVPEPSWEEPAVSSITSYGDLAHV